MVPENSDLRQRFRAEIALVAWKRRNRDGRRRACITRHRPLATDRRPLAQCPLAASRGPETYLLHAGGAAARRAAAAVPRGDAPAPLETQAVLPFSRLVQPQNLLLDAGDADTRRPPEGRPPDEVFFPVPKSVRIE